MWPAIAAAVGSTATGVGSAVLAGRSEGRIYDDAQAERLHVERMQKQARRAPQLVSAEMVFGAGALLVAVVAVKAARGR